VSTFVLVHGAWHGAWCWSRLQPELEARGHRSVVMDLPVEDGDATFEEYADVVLASYPADVEDAVLVGHSLGAMVLPLVAASRPVSMLVTLCDPQDAAWAFERLRPQNSRSLWDRPYPLTQLPNTPRAAIAAVDDAAITIEFSRAVTKPRFGVDLTEIPGAHSPFLARPGELARLLDELTVASN